MAGGKGGGVIFSHRQPGVVLVLSVVSRSVVIQQEKATYEGVCFFSCRTAKGGLRRMSSPCVTKAYEQM